MEEYFFHHYSFHNDIINESKIDSTEATAMNISCEKNSYLQTSHPFELCCIPPWLGGKALNVFLARIMLN
jgi:hypothetical protein